jgi:hypothetical protein
MARHQTPLLTVGARLTCSFCRAMAELVAGPVASHTRILAPMGARTARYRVSAGLPRCREFRDPWEGVWVV